MCAHICNCSSSKCCVLQPWPLGWNFTHCSPCIADPAGLTSHSNVVPAHGWVHHNQSCCLAVLHVGHMLLTCPQPPPCVCLRVLGSTPAAGNIVCTVSVNNTGTTRVKSIVLQGPENNCSTISVLAPGQASTPCTVHKSVSQAEFDAREADGGTTTELSVVVDVTGTANVTHSTTPAVGKAPADTTTFSGLQLVVRRNLTATASLSRLSVNVTGVSLLGNSQTDMLSRPGSHLLGLRQKVAGGCIAALSFSTQPSVG